MWIVISIIVLVIVMALVIGILVLCMGSKDRVHDIWFAGAVKFDMNEYYELEVEIDKELNSGFGDVGSYCSKMLVYVYGLSSKREGGYRCKVVCYRMYSSVSKREELEMGILDGEIYYEDYNDTFLNLHINNMRARDIDFVGYRKVEKWDLESWVKRMGYMEDMIW